MRTPTALERLAAALVGAVFGAIVGLASAWLVGVYSQSLGPTQLTVSFAKFALGGAALFGGIGVVFGVSVGTLLGTAIACLFAFERGPEDEHVPVWLVWLLLFGAAGFGWWFLRGA